MNEEQRKSDEIAMLLTVLVAFILLLIGNIELSYFLFVLGAVSLWYVVFHTRLFYKG